MRAARFKVSTDLLREVLWMPSSSTITHLSIDPNDDRVAVVVATDHTLPDASEPHDLTPTVTRKSEAWDWNVPTVPSTNTEATDV